MKNNKTIELTVKKEAGKERGLAHKIFKRLISQPDKKTITGCEYSVFTVYNHLSGQIYDPNVEIERLKVLAEIQGNNHALDLLKEAENILSSH